MYREELTQYLFFTGMGSVILVKIQTNQILQKWRRRNYGDILSQQHSVNESD